MMRDAAYAGISIMLADGVRATLEAGGVLPAFLVLMLLEVSLQLAKHWRNMPRG